MVCQGVSYDGVPHQKRLKRPRNNGGQQATGDTTDGATGESQDQGQTQDQQGDTDAGSGNQQEQQQTNTAPDKSAKAFAAMRVELAQKKKLLRVVYVII